MRIIRFINERGVPSFGIDQGDGAATEVIDRNNMIDAAVLRDPALVDGKAIDLYDTGRRTKVVRMLSPLIPCDVVCIGRNYVRDGEDAESIRAQELEVFLKPRSSIIAPGEPMRVPSVPGAQPDAHAEGELVIVIGRRMRNVKPEQALDHVLGFTLANDVTARRWSTPTGSPLWMRGKGFDTFCPLGPAIASADEFADIFETTIETRMNGVLAMCSPISRMARRIDFILAELSSRMTLHPGTIVLTGGPPLLAGMPAETTLLKPGVRVDIFADPIGTLSNPVA